MKKKPELDQARKSPARLELKGRGQQYKLYVVMLRLFNDVNFILPGGGGGGKIRPPPVFNQIFMGGREVDVTTPAPPKILIVHF